MACAEAFPEVQPIAHAPVRFETSAKGNIQRSLLFKQMRFLSGIIWLLHPSPYPDSLHFTLLRYTRLTLLQPTHYIEVRWASYEASRQTEPQSFLSNCYVVVEWPDSRALNKYELFWLRRNYRASFISLHSLLERAMQPVRIFEWLKLFDADFETFSMVRTRCLADRSFGVSMCRTALVQTSNIHCEACTILLQRGKLECGERA